MKVDPELVRKRVGARPEYPEIRRMIDRYTRERDLAQHHRGIWKNRLEDLYDEETMKVKLEGQQ